MAVARRDGGRWSMAAPEPVGDVATLPERLLDRAGGGAVALGLDLPLGLPRAFVGRHLPGVADFPAFLADLAGRPDFVRVADSLSEVSGARPFYPRANPPGLNRAAHAAALGLTVAEMSRPCDRATAERPAGASLFWTLGPNQSGKAAIAAWRDLLLPTRRPALRLWPFEGDFRALLTPGAVVVAETYPAEASRHLGVRLAGSKRAQAVRRAAAPALLAACDRLGVELEHGSLAATADGFGADAAGEDRLDCVLGLLCVLGVLGGARPDGLPPDRWLRRWEGWVLGQTALPAGFTPAGDDPLDSLGVCRIAPRQPTPGTYPP